ncbi:type I phosphomannose isomerase catalytic subunit [Deinococcus hopiensis]|uniref:type I phosphomannose isomerase catalytic subunit n=1 Tax=Deinococcus hopiensis TaxID=309885 RepID=UPI001FEB9FD7|nr:type I phosphomannose isomerase catalytic subunit [Deinococcus hopiensis]
MAARVWGGTRLGTAGDGQPAGEAWVLHEDNRVQGGSFGSHPLRELAQELPQDLLGTHTRGVRFPLLIKLLGCADWLSVQVHPNDAQAQRLVGPGELGKTEAWYILKAQPGAQPIAGVREGTSPERLRGAVLSGQVMDHAAYQAVGPGDTVFMPAGRLPALGPGLFLHEVQQTPDTTYRVYDRDRPASAGRTLHPAKRPEVTTTQPAALALPLAPGVRRERLRCDHFVLDEVREDTRLASTPTAKAFMPSRCRTDRDSSIQLKKRWI